MQLSVKAMTWSLGLFGAVSFVLCVIYGLLAPLRCTQRDSWR